MQSNREPYQSPTLTFTAGQPLEFRNWVPLVGRDRKRVVIDYIVIRVIGTVTVATANWDGRDVWRLLGLITVEDTAGQMRWSLDGFESRIASIEYNGITRHQEHAAVAVGASQAVDLYALIPFSKPMVYDGEDYALPADCLSKVVVNCNAAASAQTGSAVLTLGTLTVYINAAWHEEGAARFKAEDFVRSVAFTSNTQGSFSPGATIHDMGIIRTGNTTAGGEVITAITDVRAALLGMAQTTRLDLVHKYRVLREQTASGPTTPGTERVLSPVTQGIYLPVWMSSPDTSVHDGNPVDTFVMDLGTGAANLKLLLRTVANRNANLVNQQAARFGVRSVDQLQVATSYGDRRELSEWPKEKRSRVPVEAPLNWSTK